MASSSRTAKPVIQLNLNGQTVQVFASVKEAALKGFDGSRIRVCCGLPMKESHKGYYWKYVNLKPK